MATCNLIEELGVNTDEVVLEIDKDLAEDPYEEIFKAMKAALDVVERNTEQIETLRKKAAVETGQLEHKNIVTNVQRIIDETNGKIRNDLTSNLQKLKEESDKDLGNNDASIAHMMLSNRLNSTSIAVGKIVAKFNDTTERFQTSLHGKFARQARIIKADITEEEIDMIMSSPNPGQCLQQLMEVPDTMVDRLVEIEERHEGILNIQKGVKEIQEMWQDLSLLVDAQAELMDQVEKNVAATKNYTLKGVEHLKKAETYQLAARRKTLWILCILVTIALVIFFSVMGPKIFD